MKQFYILLVTLLFTSLGFGQTTLYTQDFETDITGYSHSPSQTPSTDAGDQYFYRAEPSDSSIYEGSVGPYSNVTGSWLFVGSNPKAINSGSNGVLSFDPINVTGYSNFELSADFGGVPDDWDATDNLSVEYSWDNTNWNLLYDFQSPITNDPLVLNNNAVGGKITANGAILTYVLQTIVSNNFTGSGSSLYIRVVCNSNANYEAFGVDNFVLTGVASSSDPTIAFDTASSSETETDATFSVNVPVTVTNYSGTQIDVSAAVSGGTAEVADYTLNTASLSFTADGTQNVSIDIVPDTDDFDDETIIITLTETSSVTDLDISNNTHTITVTEDDSPPSVGFDNATSTETETDVTFTSANIPITVSNYSGTQIDVNISVTGGTAEAGDYTFTSPTSLSFTTNETQNITIDINEDTDDFDDETIIFTLTETSSVSGLVISQSTHTLTITEDEMAPAPTAGNVFITEVSDDVGGDFNAEFLEIFNNSNEVVSLATSKLVRVDGGTNVSEYVFDFGIDESTADVDIMIPAYGFIIVTRAASRAEFDTDQGSTLPVSVNYNGGNTNNYFGSSSRRWRLRVGGTTNTDDGILIDDTGAELGGTRIYQNISTTTFVSDSDTNASPGTLEYLVYNGGAWVNSAAIDGTTGTEDAYFYDNFTISSNSEANDIGISTGNTLTINSSIGLVANGTITNNGTITLNSTSSSYASLIANSVSGGTVNYNRHVNEIGTTNASNNGNDLISPPVTSASQNFGTFAAANSNLSASGTLRAFAVFDNTVNTVDDPNGKYINYDTSLNSGTPISSGVGYRAATDDGSALTFSGDVNTGTVAVGIAIGVGSQWNLIGNPYPSYLNVQGFLNNTTNAGLLDETNVGIYGYNADTSVWTIYNLLTTDANTSITPGQGFFVAAEANGDIQFTSGMRQIGTTDDFIAGRNSNPANHVMASVELTKGAEKLGTDIYFVNNMTRGLDPGYDAGAFQGNADGIFTHLVENNTGVEMAIQALPYNDFNDVVVPLGVKLNAGEQISIGLNSVSTLPANINVYLEDNVTNIWTLLNDGDYTITPSTNMDGVGRFFIHFTTGTLSAEDSILTGLQIYADNSSRSVVIKGKLNAGTQASIYDLQGRKVVEQELNSSVNTNIINVNNISTGLYIVELSDFNKIRTQKVIIK